MPMIDRTRPQWPQIPRAALRLRRCLILGIRVGFLEENVPRTFRGTSYFHKRHLIERDARAPRERTRNVDDGSSISECVGGGRSTKEIPSWGKHHARAYGHERYAEHPELEAELVVRISARPIRAINPKQRECKKENPER